MMEKPNVAVTVFGKSLSMSVKECIDHEWHGGKENFAYTLSGDPFTDMNVAPVPGYKRCHYKMNLIAVYDDGTEETVLTAEEKKEATNV